jgi:hypothetical protein
MVLVPGAQGSSTLLFCKSSDAACRSQLAAHSRMVGRTAKRAPAMLYIVPPRARALLPVQLAVSSPSPGPHSHEMAKLVTPPELKGACAAALCGVRPERARAPQVTRARELLRRRLVLARACALFSRSACSRPAWRAPRQRAPRLAHAARPSFFFLVKAPLCADASPRRCLRRLQRQPVH